MPSGNIFCVIKKLLFLAQKKERLNTCIQQGHIQLIISDSKDTYNITKDFYLT